MLTLGAQRKPRKNHGTLRHTPEAVDRIHREKRKRKGKKKKKKEKKKAAAAEGGRRYFYCFYIEKDPVRDRPRQAKKLFRFLEAFYGFLELKSSENELRRARSFDW